MEYLMVVTGFPTIDWQAVQLYPSCSQNNIDSPFQVLRLALHLPPLVVHFLSFLRKRGKRSRCWCCKEWPEPVPHLSYLTLAGGPVDSTTLQKDHWSWGWGFPPGSTISQNCECKFFSPCFSSISSLFAGTSGTQLGLTPLSESPIYKG